jgi:hypothetical protein
MPRRKGKTKSIITQDQEEITPKKTTPLGATRTHKGTTTTNDQGRTTRILGLTYLALFVVSIYIIHTISPKLTTSNGWKNP